MKTELDQIDFEYLKEHTNQNNQIIALYFLTIWVFVAICTLPLIILFGDNENSIDEKIFICIIILIVIFFPLRLIFSILNFRKSVNLDIINGIKESTETKVIKKEYDNFENDFFKLFLTENYYSKNKPILIVQQTDFDSINIGDKILLEYLPNCKIVVRATFNGKQIQMYSMQQYSF